MGLDLVEIVMEVEEEFGVPIDHDTVPLTPGGLLDATLVALRIRHGERFEFDPNYPDQVWKQLRAMIANQLSVEVAEVTKTANFITDLGCV